LNVGAQNTVHFQTCAKSKKFFANIYQSEFESHQVLKIEGPFSACTAIGRVTNNLSTKLKFPKENGLPKAS
jgi:hypothetical protein